MILRFQGSLRNKQSLTKRNLILFAVALIIPAARGLSSRYQISAFQLQRSTHLNDVANYYQLLSEVDVDTGVDCFREDEISTRRQKHSSKIWYIWEQEIDTTEKRHEDLSWFRRERRMLR